MDMKILFVFFSVGVAGAYGVTSSSPTLSIQYTLYSQQSKDNNEPGNTKDNEELSNYAISRNRIGNERQNNGGYGQYYNGNYPSGPGYPGNYPGGNYPGGNYPGYHPGPPGPPGAHPGCPLCDSSVYSYCSRKQAHDACCCNSGGFSPFGCDKASCKFLHANSCQEHQLISNCCCVDLYKDAGQAVVTA